MEAKINIFYLSHDPVQCAQWHVDKHVVKMILESCQLLSTAHRVLDGTQTIEKRYVAGSLPARWRNIKRWKLANSEHDKMVYQATHINHPSAVWVRQSSENYSWLHSLTIALLVEYEYRYGKEHKCKNLANHLSRVPKNIPKEIFTQPTQAMPEEYKVYSDSIAAYRKYYIGAKARMASWKNRVKPDWFDK